MRYSYTNQNLNTIGVAGARQQGMATWQASSGYSRKASLASCRTAESWSTGIVCHVLRHRRLLPRYAMPHAWAGAVPCPRTAATKQHLCIRVVYTQMNAFQIAPEYNNEWALMNSKPPVTVSPSSQTYVRHAPAFAATVRYCVRTHSLAEGNMFLRWVPAYC